MEPRRHLVSAADWKRGVANSSAVLKNTDSLTDITDMLTDTGGNMRTPTHTCMHMQADQFWLLMSVLLPPAAETGLCVERSGKKKKRKKPCGRRGDCKLGAKNPLCRYKGMSRRRLHLNAPPSISPISNVAVTLSGSFAGSFSS